MMRAKADPKATSNVILGLACLFLLATVVGIVLPKPQVADVARNERNQTKRIQSSIRGIREQATVAKASVVARTWSEDPSQIQAQLVNLTTTLAKKRGVEWQRLQPQKPIVGGPLEQVPFVLVVEGPFPAVAALQRDLEASTNRLAISLFQLASANSESNRVSASIGLVANRAPLDVEEGGSNAKRS